jgi:hypothetical protein
MEPNRGQKINIIIFWLPKAGIFPTKKKNDLKMPLALSSSKCEEMTGAFQKLVEEIRSKMIILGIRLGY